jgi:hypothetical protein
VQCEATNIEMKLFLLVDVQQDANFISHFLPGGSETRRQSK